MIIEAGKVIAQQIEVLYDAADRREIDPLAELLIPGSRLRAELTIDCEVARHQVLGVVLREVLLIMAGMLAIPLTTRRALHREGFPLGGSAHPCTRHGAHGRHTAMVARETFLGVAQHLLGPER